MPTRRRTHNQDQLGHYTQRNRARSTAEFKRNRRALLTGNPLCHWCNAREATTADHLIEIDRWPANTHGINALENLVAACKPCNSSRGARYGNLKRKGIYERPPQIANALNTSNSYTVTQLDIAATTPSLYVRNTGTGPSAIRLLAFNNSTYIQSGTSTASTSADLVFSSMGAISEWIRILGSTGNVGIGTASPAYKLDVNGNIHATAFPTSSDIRFKKNITPLENSLEKIKKLQGVKYEWNEFVNSKRDGYKLNVPIIGLIAQDVEKIVPEVVDLWKLSDDCQDARSIDYPRLIPVLIEAIKEQQIIIENQNQKIENLIARMSALEAK